MILNTTQEQNKIIPHKDYQSNRANGKNTSPVFRGWADAAFLALEQSEIMGPLAIDTLGMTGPRTVIDFTRGENAGMETMRRETISTANAFLLPGMYALGVGYLLNKFKGPNLFIAGDMVEELSKIWKNNKGAEDFIQNTLNSAEGLVGDKYVKFSEKGIAEKFTPGLLELINKPPEKENVFKRAWAFITRKNKGKMTVNSLANEAAKMMGAESSIKLNGKTNTDMKNLFRNIVDMTKAFSNDPNCGSTIKRNGIIKSGAGIGLAFSIALGLQYLNRYITSRKTGTSAFVGLPDYNDNTKNYTSAGASGLPEEEAKKKKQRGLLPLKIASVAAMTYMTVASVLGKWTPKGIKETCNLKNLGKIIEMKSKIPTLAHMKLIIGSTLIGRMLASDDEYELRETAVRDILFTFPFILIVNNLLKQLAAWKLANNKKIGNIRDKVFNMDVDAKRTVEDIEKIKNPVKKVIGILGLKMKTYSEMGDNIVAKNTKNKAVLFSILFSSFVTGFGVPFLNKWMTESTYKKEGHKSSSFDSFRKNLHVAQGFGV